MAWFNRRKDKKEEERRRLEVDVATSDPLHARLSRAVGYKEDQYSEQEDDVIFDLHTSIRDKSKQESLREKILNSKLVRNTAAVLSLYAALTMGVAEYSVRRDFQEVPAQSISIHTRSDMEKFSSEKDLKEFLPHISRTSLNDYVGSVIRTNYGNVPNLDILWTYSQSKKEPSIFVKLPKSRDYFISHGFHLADGTYSNSKEIGINETIKILGHGDSTPPENNDYRLFNDRFQAVLNAFKEMRRIHKSEGIASN